MISAPVLHDVAGQLAGRDPKSWSEDPMRWAYAMREAVNMVEPAWVVSHFDPEFECRAIVAAAGEPDAVWDVVVDGEGPFAPGIELVRTLACLDSSWTVAASVTGPLSTARVLCAGWKSQPEDPADLESACGDVTAALAAAYAEAGAGELIVWELNVLDIPERVEAAHQALLRRAAHVGVPVSLIGPTTAAGYARTVGAGVLALDPAMASDPASLAVALSEVRPDTVVVTDGPLPGDTAPEALRGFAATATAGGR